MAREMIRFGVGLIVLAIVGMILAAHFAGCTTSAYDSKSDTLRTSTIGGSDLSRVARHRENMAEIAIEGEEVREEYKLANKEIDVQERLAKAQMAFAQKCIDAGFESVWVSTSAAVGTTGATRGVYAGRQYDDLRERGYRAMAGAGVYGRIVGPGGGVNCENKGGDARKFDALRRDLDRVARVAESAADTADATATIQERLSEKAGAKEVR